MLEQNKIFNPPFSFLASSPLLGKVVSTFRFLVITSVFTLPIIILLVGILLSVKYSAYRKPIGVGLITIGILEMLPFLLFILTHNDVAHSIPYTPLSIIFIEGCITLVGGIMILLITKTKETKPNPS